MKKTPEASKAAKKAPNPEAGPQQAPPNTPQRASQHLPSRRTSMRSINSQVIDDSPDSRPLQRKRRLGSMGSEAVNSADQRRSSWAFWNDPKPRQATAKAGADSADPDAQSIYSQASSIFRSGIEREARSWSFWTSQKHSVVKEYPFEPNTVVDSTVQNNPASPGRRTASAAVNDSAAAATTTTSDTSILTPNTDPATAAAASAAAAAALSEYDSSFATNPGATIDAHASSSNDPVSAPVTPGTSGRKGKPGKKPPQRPNLIVPAIEETLPPATAYSAMTAGFKRAKMMLGYENNGERFLYRKDKATPFKRVLIIGVHGFFPNKVLRPLIGEPTGTSMKFCQVADSAVRSWAKENGEVVQIQKIALEKEGKVFDRVDYFYDILKRAQGAIDKADFIFVCAHSQGTPVSIILLSKLLEHGVISADKRIGILGMAGISNGPFYGMDQSLVVRAYSAFENESLLELFQFQNFESLQSRKYLEAIRNLVRHNARITYVGSIDDQLVPLYSSVASHVSHPNIYKAVYIDGGSNTPDFVARIVKMSTKLQDLGYSDHDVLKEISPALAGPLTGGGHSNIYNDQDVYKLALNFTLKTEDSKLAIEQPVHLNTFDLKRVGKNPYNLPWCVRGLFFEAQRRLEDGSKEVDMVFKEFDQWKPQTKTLKDVKYRLNGIKAKL